MGIPAAAASLAAGLGSAAGLGGAGLALGPVGWGLTAVSLLASAYGALKNAKENRKYDTYLDRQRQELETMFNKEYYTPYLDTKDAKAAIRSMLTDMDNVNEKNSSSSAITGGTAEKEVATKDKLNENFTDALNQLAGLGEDKKRAVKSDYMADKAYLDSQNLQNIKNKAANFNQLQQNSMNLMGNTAMASSSGAMDGWNEKLRAMFARKPGSFNFDMSKFNAFINPNQNLTPSMSNAGIFNFNS